MLSIAIEFVNNRGSFPLDALAQTFRGDWDSRSSTEDSGIITNVADDAEEWVKEILAGDDNVASYTIITE
jgi:hypothetical protein